MNLLIYLNFNFSKLIFLFFISLFDVLLFFDIQKHHYIYLIFFSFKINDLTVKIYDLSSIDIKLESINVFKISVMRANSLSFKYLNN